MSDTELLIEEIKTLPADYVTKVLEFVKSIKNNSNDEAADTSWFEKGEECPICAKHRDPKTGEPLYNAETVAGMQEVEDMITGKVPTKWYNSLEEMLVDLDSDD